MSETPENDSLSKLTGFAKPVETLINKIAEGSGILYEPTRIKRKAMAEAMANELKTVSDIRITDIQRRAANRFVEEQTLMQSNIESVTTKALPDIKEDAKPEDIENDWVMNFFDKVRLVSDEQMQGLWAKLLAGEANAPGSYSKRTINLLSSLDKSDAESFSNLVRFTWFIHGYIPLVYSVEDEIYTTNKINFQTLTHLDSIGLIKFSSMTTGIKKRLPKQIKVHYAEMILDVEFPKELNELEVGGVFLTKSGEEIASLCEVEPIPGFVEYVLDLWTGDSWASMLKRLIVTPSTSNSSPD